MKNYFFLKMIVQIENGILNQNFMVIMEANTTFKAAGDKNYIVSNLQQKGWVLSFVIKDSSGSCRFYVFW